jgi:hypothetical protein
MQQDNVRSSDGRNRHVYLKRWRIVFGGQDSPFLRHVCSILARERIHRFAPNSACLFLRPGREHRKVKTPERVMSSSPGEDGSCSSETKQIEERHQDESSLSRIRDYRCAVWINRAPSGGGTSILGTCSALWTQSRACAFPFFPFTFPFHQAWLRSGKPLPAFLSRRRTSFS